MKKFKTLILLFILLPLITLAPLTASNSMDAIIDLKPKPVATVVKPGLFIRTSS